MAATFEIGDAIPLTWTVTVGGVATNATVALTVTLPDGTTTSPTVTNPSTGNYAASLTASQSGPHAARWVATGAVTAAETVVFTVGGLISLAEAKKEIGRTDSTDTADDAEIQDFIDAATLACDHIAGGQIMASTYTEWRDGGDTEIALTNTPVVSVTSVTEYRGVSAQALTAQPLGSGSYNGFGYVLDIDRVRRVAGGMPIPFFAGRANVKLVYIAGYTAPPADANIAARVIFAHLWGTQNNPGSYALPDDDSTFVPGLGYAVPSRAVDLLARIRTYRPGFA